MASTDDDESGEQPRMLSVDFDTMGQDECYFRILVGGRVKYVTVLPSVLDEESLLDMPLNFVDILPPLPYHQRDWNSAEIVRSKTSGNLEFALRQSELPAVKQWHPEMINFLDLERNRQLAPLTQEAVWKGDSEKPESLRRLQGTMIAKMARFPWEVQYMEQETRIYELLQSSGVAPEFLGHVHEEGRIIGFLLQKLDGRAATLEDIPVCQTALMQLHSRGISHGDVNKYNFIVSDLEAKAYLIDFEKAETDIGDSDVMAKEIESLEEKFSDTSGAGAGYMVMTEGDPVKGDHGT